MLLLGLECLWPRVCRVSVACTAPEHGTSGVVEVVAYGMTSLLHNGSAFLSMPLVTEG